MLTIDVERSGGVAVVHCSGRLVRGVEVCTLEECGGLGEDHAHRGARPLAGGIHGCGRVELAGVTASLDA